MSDNVTRLEAELDIAKMCEEYEALRPVVEDKETYTDEAMARYRELNDLIAEARTAFKVAYGPAPAEPGDAVATPAPIEAETH